VLRLLRGQASRLRARGITSLDLFGSMARGEAGPDSDVDLIADIDRGISFSLLDLVGLQDFLRDLVGREVDVGTTVAKMRPRVRARFAAEAIEVFLMTASASASRLQEQRQTMAWPVERA
jgi:predicted nucleotidyltransferase